MLFYFNLHSGASPPDTTRSEDTRTLKVRYDIEKKRGIIITDIQVSFVSVRLKVDVAGMKFVRCTFTTRCGSTI